MNIFTQPESRQRNSIIIFHGPESWLALTEEINVGALVLPPICAEYGLETRHPQIERILVLALDLHLISAENGHETWLASCEEILVFARDV
jgi:hypothetical protein